MAVRSEFGPPDNWTFGPPESEYATYDFASNGTIVSNRTTRSYHIRMGYASTNRQQSINVYQFPGNESVFLTRKARGFVTWDVSYCHPTVIPERSIESESVDCLDGGRRLQGSESESESRNRTDLTVYHNRQFGLSSVVTTVLTEVQFAAEEAVVRQGQTYIVYRTPDTAEADSTAVIRDDGLIRSLSVRYGEDTHLDYHTELDANSSFGVPSWAGAARNDSVYYDFSKVAEKAPTTDQDCSDFATQAGAQIYHETTGGSGLDGDGDGVACE